jgi:flagellar hook-basal body complex protein FliE
MSMSISPVRLPQIPDPVQQPSKPAGVDKAFQTALESAIDHVEKSNHTAATSIRQVLNGETDELHNAVLATQQAELQFDLFLQVRNKVVSAYQEIMKMQV